MLRQTPGRPPPDAMQQQHASSRKPCHTCDMEEVWPQLHKAPGILTEGCQVLGTHHEVWPELSHAHRHPSSCCRQPPLQVCQAGTAHHQELALVREACGASRALSAPYVSHSSMLSENIFCNRMGWFVLSALILPLNQNTGLSLKALAALANKMHATRYGPLLKQTPF